MYEDRIWFSDKNYTTLEIKKYKSISDHAVVKGVIINDVAAIQHLQKRIETIPANGDMMKSFGGEAEHIDLIFYKEGKKETQHIFQRRFQTPSTGFNSGKDGLEEKLYRDIDGMLFPEVNKIIFKIENLEMLFKGFYITYKGSSFHDFAPVTVSFTKYIFNIKDKNNKEQLIEIASGQLPPQPFLFEVNNSKFKILTYKAKDGERLYPEYFQIVDAN